MKLPLKKIITNSLASFVLVILTITLLSGTVSYKGASAAIVLEPGTVMPNGDVVPPSGVSGSGAANPAVSGSGASDPAIRGTGASDPSIRGSGATNPAITGSGSTNPLGNSGSAGGSGSGQGSGSGSGSGSNVNSGGVKTVGLATLKNPLKVNTVDELLGLAVQVALRIGTILAVLALMWVGFQFIVAQGDEGKITAAKEHLWYVVIGIAVFFGATVIVAVIKATLSPFVDTSSFGSKP